MYTKILILSLLILSVICRDVQRLPGQKLLVTYVDRLSSYWGDKSVPAAIAMPGYSPDNDYTVINLAFILNFGCADASCVWIKPFGFMEKDNNIWGKDQAVVQKKWLDLYHAAGKKILLSAFGATQFPTSQGFDAVETCTTMAQLVKDNNLDGIDLDYEDNEAMNRGEGAQWLIDCTIAIRKVLPVGQYILTHAPQAPYFVGSAVYPDDAYKLVNDVVGHLIDWYNVQFYNQGDTEYNSYELLFIDAKYGDWKGTAVAQIIAQGVPSEKIVIGKPATRGDATNTGYVPWGDMHDWAAQAANDERTNFWQTGIMTWQYSNDVQGNIIGEYLNGRCEKSIEY